MGQGVITGRFQLANMLPHGDAIPFIFSFSFSSLVSHYDMGPPSVGKVKT